MYKVKYKTNDSINQYKARTVGKGYVQQHGIDYDEMFMLVTTMKIVRVLLAVVVAKG